MQKVRDGLHGNFIPLRRAVAAVAARITIPDEEIESRRGLNAALDANDFVATLDRAIIRNVVSQARAAAILLSLLNQPSASRPQWLDAAPGYPILDDSVGRQGVEALIQWARGEVALVVTGGPRGWPALTPPAPELMGRPSRSMQIGFNIDELIHFLDAKGVAHNLGEALNPPVLAAQGTALTSAVGAVVSPSPVACAPTKGKIEPAESIPMRSASIWASSGRDPCAEGSPVATSVSAPTGRFNDFRRPGKRCPIEREILEAKVECAEPLGPREIMGRLLQKAEAGHPVLKIKNGTLHYVGNDGRLVLYTLNALRQFISPKNEAKRAAARELRLAADTVKAQSAPGRKATPSAG